MPSSADFASNMVANLALTEPTLDTSIGSIARKIIDAVAVQLSEQSADSHLIRYTYDIDSKSGAALTDFVALFGLKRLAAGRATGVVTFKRTAKVAATQLSKVNLGVQVTTQTEPPQTFQAVMNATLARGQLSVDVPVQAFTPGPGGNVAAGMIIYLASSIEGVQSVTNAQPCTGGTNQESDEHLRARFKTSVFRNLAGTADMYRAMALQTPAEPDPSVVSLPVTAANVIGPRMTYQEQVMIKPDGTATSSIPDAAHIYGQSVFLGRNIAGGDIEARGPDQAYTVAIDNTITAAHPHASLVVSSVDDSLSKTKPYDLQFDYVSDYSRNDPFGTRWEGGAYVSTRVDLWINGLRPNAFTQSCRFSNNASLIFTVDSAHQGDMDPTRYRMLYPNMTYDDPDDTTGKKGKMRPVQGDHFTPLLRGPVLTVPNRLTNSNTNEVYQEGVHYDVVHQGDAFGYGPTSRYGLVWHQAAGAGNLPAAGAKFVIDYTYDRAPTLVQQKLESQWRLLGTDLQVHGGVARYYRFHLAVVYLPGRGLNAVNLGINNALNRLVNSLGFRSALQVSDVLQAVHNVNGVDNVRFLNSDDDPDTYGIQRLYRDPLYDANNPPPGHTTPDIEGPVVHSSDGRAKDVYFNDASYPVFDPTMSPVHIVVKARNTFGAT